MCCNLMTKILKIFGMVYTVTILYRVVFGLYSCVSGKYVCIFRYPIKYFPEFELMYTLIKQNWFEPDRSII